MQEENLNKDLDCLDRSVKQNPDTRYQIKRIDRQDLMREKNDKRLQGEPIMIRYRVNLDDYKQEFSKRRESSQRPVGRSSRNLDPRKPFTP